MKSVSLPVSAVVGAALAFAVITTSLSWGRWANFGYTTFDLAFYVQGLWLFLHGKFHVSLLHVPILGNHVEPIVFLLAPLFALIQHPMTLVAAQNAALATMAPTGYAICRRLGLPPLSAALLGCATLAAPAAGFIALHEFHPEAFSAPFLLLMFHARLRGSLAGYWLWFAAVLCCKENMTLLLAAYGVVQAIADRRLGWRHLWRWDLGPAAVAIAWLVLCGKVITPALNRGHVEYVALYSRLGDSAPQIVRNFFTEPQRLLDALSDSLTHGNLPGALLLPFALLPLLRARWLVIAAPILMQHLLSWRQSEWMIYFHYSAPILPLFWMATAEAVAWFGGWRGNASNARPMMGSGIFSPARALPVVVLLACLAAQWIIGPAARLPKSSLADVATARAAVAGVPPNASVLAPIPYLSHLAMRDELHSLHHVLKGLKTLSRSEYEPPAPADIVIIDSSDAATFDPGSGYFHPAMQTVDGRVIPSSERLLHEYLSRATWLPELTNSVAVYRRGIQAASGMGEPEGVAVTPETRLISWRATGSGNWITVRLAWRFTGEREVIPWMELEVIDAGGRTHGVFTKGLCAPDGYATGGVFTETWRCALPATAANFADGARANFYDHSQRVWSKKEVAPLMTIDMSERP